MGGSRCRVFCGKGFDDAQESRKSQFYGHKKYRTLANPVPERSFYRPGLDKKKSGEREDPPNREKHWERKNTALQSEP